MQNTIDALEWQNVLDHLSGLCQTGYGRVLITNPDFMTRDIATLQHSMAIVDEGKIILQRYGDVSLQEPADIVPTLERLQKGGGLSSAQELGEVLTALKAMRLIIRHLVQNSTKNETPLITEEISTVASPNAVIEMLASIVQENGELKDSASPQYASLRKRVVDSKARIIDMLNATMRNQTVAKSLQETVVTEREGRFVLSVKAENRADVPGIVLGSSTTGSTLYIEPNHVIEVQNQFKSLLGELDQEIRRILEQVSNNLRPDVEILLEFIDKTGRLDLLLAKARQSLSLKANPVSIIEEPGVLKLRSAKHPLLIRQLDHVVANDIFLEIPYKTILITGPNTGGKTVLLKLIGLFALMLEAGLHLPCAEGSAMSLFNPVLIDIGDPQSIEQNLSTFSGHMARMKSFLDEPDLSRGLILVDEICAGTDPQEGAALAQALLEAFYNRGATTIATTHIGELKVAAHQHPGYLNASVAFDEKTLGPTYQLLLGVPGTSHAIEIAGYLGISNDVLESARSKISKPQSEAAELIADLQMKYKTLNDELATVQKLREDIAWEEEQMRTQLNRIEGEKRKTLQLFREGLSQKFRIIEREVDDLKKDLQSAEENLPDSQTLHKYSKRYKQAQSEAGQVFSEETQKLYPNPGIDWDKLAVGDTVSSRSLNMTGVITEKHEVKKEVTIQSGILKATLPVSDIISQQKQQKSQKNKKSGSGRSSPMPSALSMDCDVRGMRADDAVLMVENSLDEAIQKGYGSVNVIHGLGTGALKKAIREHLKSLPYVRSFGPATAMEGGDGKTVITL